MGKKIQLIGINMQWRKYSAHFMFCPCSFWGRQSFLWISISWWVRAMQQKIFSLTCSQLFLVTNQSQSVGTSMYKDKFTCSRSYEGIMPARKNWVKLLLVFLFFTQGKNMQSADAFRKALLHTYIPQCTWNVQ